MSPTPRSPAGKILVIDDDPVVLRSLSLILESGAYEVFEASDAPGAFSLARRIRPDLIVLDIFFPPDAGQSGNTWDAFKIIDWFQRMGVINDTPVIIISGAESDQFRERCLLGGMAAFFSKPVDAHELLDAVRRILAGRTRKPARQSVSHRV